MVRPICPLATPTCSHEAELDELAVTVAGTFGDGPAYDSNQPFDSAIRLVVAPTTVDEDAAWDWLVDVGRGARYVFLRHGFWSRTGSGLSI